MVDSEAVLTEVRQALRGGPRVDFDRQSIHLTFAKGELLITGEVASIAAKRRAVIRAATISSVTRIVDELCVRSKMSLPDGEIRDLLGKALVEEPTLGGCTIREGSRGGFRMLRMPLTVVGRMDFKVRQGVVTLEGEAPSLAQKRLASVLSHLVTLNRLAARVAKQRGAKLWHYRRPADAYAVHRCNAKGFARPAAGSRALGQVRGAAVGGLV
jgi:hypothetical protein